MDVRQRACAGAGAGQVVDRGPTRGRRGTRTLQPSLPAHAHGAGLHTPNVHTLDRRQVWEQAV